MTLTTGFTPLTLIRAKENMITIVACSHLISIIILEKEELPAI
jgi:hypothetical protein